MIGVPRIDEGILHILIDYNKQSSGGTKRRRTSRPGWSDEDDDQLRHRTGEMKAGKFKRKPTRSLPSRGEHWATGNPVFKGSSLMFANRDTAGTGLSRVVRV